MEPGSQSVGIQMRYGYRLETIIATSSACGRSVGAGKAVAVGFAVADGDGVGVDCCPADDEDVAAGDPAPAPHAATVTTSKAMATP